MNVEKKQTVVDELADKMSKATALYLTDFSGLNVKRITDLRARLRREGVEYLVVKNTLAQRALGDLDLPDIGRFFTGPTGLVIGHRDPIAPAKILDEFAREHDARPAIKVGVVERREVSAEQVARLARLPSREQLLAEAAGAFQAPLAQLAFMLQGMLGEFVGLIDALRTERERA